MAGRPKCKSCDTVFDIAEPTAGCIQLPNELFDETVCVGKGEQAKKRKQKFLDEFYQDVNALINNGSGFLFLHAKKPYQLSAFNEIIGSRLLTLIPDDSYYHDNIDINIFDDKHIVFRIQRRERQRKSFYSFNTKLSLDKGLHDLTHTQFYGEIKRIRTETEKPETEKTKTAKKTPKASHKSVGFVRDGGKYLAKLSSSRSFSLNDSIEFVESVEIQAKRAPSQAKTTEGILSYVLDTCKLAQYITAFAKLPRGGSLYVGIAEDKIGESKTGRYILDTVNTDWQKVIDRGQTKLQSEIAKAVKDRACFLGNGGVIPDDEIPEDIVEVEFPYDKKARMHIMEVRVKPFPGLILFDKEGAELYRLKKDHKSGERKRKRDSFKDWVKDS